MEKVFVKPKTPIWIYLMSFIFFMSIGFIFWLERSNLNCSTSNCEIEFWTYIILLILVLIICLFSFFVLIWRNTGSLGNRFIISPEKLIAPQNGFLKGKQEVVIGSNEIIDIKLIEPKGYSFHYVIKFKLTSGAYEIVFFPHEKKFYFELLDKIREFYRQ